MPSNQKKQEMSDFAEESAGLFSRIVSLLKLSLGRRGLICRSRGAYVPRMFAGFAIL